MLRKINKTTSLIIFTCTLAICVFCAYLLYNYWFLPMKVNEENKRYAELYEPAATHQEAYATISIAPTEKQIVTPSAIATIAPTITPTITATPEPSPAASETPKYTFGALVDVELGTANPETIVYTAATQPPTLEAFCELINANPETAGFLTVGEEIRLPVVQKANDNEYYLTHNFEGAESKTGCLFIDGSNRIYPSDDCIYVYGHNMKNGTMFGKLSDLSKVSVLKKNSVAYFDTIYETGVYVPFACFALTANMSASDYFEIRQFEFDEESFDKYVSSLKEMSSINIPVSVEYGDRLLLLVTCNYSVSDGRFVVAFRRLRDNESEQTAHALVGQSEKKK